MLGVGELANDSLVIDLTFAVGAAVSYGEERLGVERSGQL